MIRNWLMVEHHRLHLVEQWPESAHRSATLAAIRKSIETLTCNYSGAASHSHCTQCGSTPASPPSRVLD
jgi:hypothetical protein